jgi:phage gp29-like protein
MVDKIKKPLKPDTGEIAPAEDPLQPLNLTRLASAKYSSLLLPTDSVLTAKGSVENLKIYSELLRDDQVSAGWEQRKLMLTKCETIVDPGGDDAASIAAAEALQEELDALPWDDITDKMLSGVFYGWSVAEVMWTAEEARIKFAGIKVRDRSRFRFDRDRTIYLWTNASGFRVMPERKFWAFSAGADHHDEPYGLGLAHKLYWPVFFKRSDIKFWLIFLEKFGMPTSIAKIPLGQMNDAAVIAKVKTALQQIATDAGVIVPDTIPIELLEAARSGSADYGGMHEAMNRAISKILVGQTATTEGTPGKLGADDTQQDVLQSIVEADSDILCGSFNAGPVKWWTEWNFPGAKPPRVWRRTMPEEDLGMTAERDKKISDLGFEPEEAYIKETYGQHWKKKQAQAVDPLLGKRGGDPAQFVEGEVQALATLRAAQRADQDALADAAEAFAEQYQTIMGKRVKQILDAANFSEDPELLRKRLNDLLSEAPVHTMVEKVSRGTFFARMMGAFRAKRA